MIIHCNSQLKHNESSSDFQTTTVVQEDSEANNHHIRTGQIIRKPAEPLDTMSKWRRPFTSRSDAWWADGIAFTCIDECGRCCNEKDGIVYLSREDAGRISGHLGKDLKEWLTESCRTSYDGRFVLESKREDGTCIYLGEKMACSIYDVKPAQCSAFPFWQENLVSERKWNKVKENCPGIDHVEAIIISGKTIALHLDADMEAERGFRYI